MEDERSLREKQSEIVDLIARGKKIERIKQELQKFVRSLFPPDFMKRHTEYKSLKAFLREGFDQYQSVADISRLPRNQLNDYIRRETKFIDWPNFLREAIKHYEQTRG